MSGATMLWLALAGWFAIGVVLSYVLGRRGHDSYSWFVLGAMLGPLAIAFAIYAWRHDEGLELEPLAASEKAFPRTGVDVLVGFDESPASRAAIGSVIEILGPRLGRLALVTVIPFDGGEANEKSAREALQREGEQLAWLAPELQIVRGHPATALVHAATNQGFDLLAAGATGLGRAHLFGSAARELARQSTVPVLLGAHASKVA